MKKITIICLLVFSNVFAQDLNENLLLHYAFNGNANDSSTNNYDGSASGVTYGPDRFGNPNEAAYFNGIDNFIDLPNLLALKPEFPLSFSFWINYSSEDYQDRAVFNTSFEDDRSSGVYFNTQISTGNYAINYGDGTYNYISSARRSYVSNEPITINNWHHVAIIIQSATDMSIYIDCLENGGSYSGSGGNLVYSDTPGSIGRRDRNLNVAAHYFKGALDDFRYWDRVLTLNEVTTLCNSLSVPENDFSNNLVKLFPNPTNGLLNISSKIDLNAIIIYNTLGQQVYKTNYQDNIDLRFLSKGVYFIELKHKDFTTRKQLIITAN